MWMSTVIYGCWWPRHLGVHIPCLFPACSLLQPCYNHVYSLPQPCYSHVYSLPQPSYSHATTMRSYIKPYGRYKAKVFLAPQTRDGGLIRLGLYGVEYRAKRLGAYLDGVGVIRCNTVPCDASRGHLTRTRDEYLKRTRDE